VGELFRSFDESWAHFLAREEPLESFAAGLPADESAHVAVWLIALDPRLVPRARELQERLPRLDWLRPLPDHFLHVTVGGVGVLDDRRRLPRLLESGVQALEGLPAFRLSFPRLNCFHEAVVAEVEGEGVHAAAGRLREEQGPFLPHLSLAYTSAPGPPHELRNTLVKLRDTSLGAQEVRELRLCLVPAARTTILEPWSVVGAVELG
jgi:2'-5' RNA ligase